MNLMVIWLITIVICIVIEVFTGWLVFFSVAIGALVALIAEWCGASAAIQLLLLAIAAVCTYIVAIPLVKRYHDSAGRQAYYDSNIGALIGRKARVTEAIGNDSLGRVRVDGDNWQARTADGTAVSKGAMVEITGIDSIIVTVKPLPEA